MWEIVHQAGMVNEDDYTRSKSEVQDRAKARSQSRVYAKVDQAAKRAAQAEPDAVAKQCK